MWSCVNVFSVNFYRQRNLELTHSDNIYICELDTNAKQISTCTHSPQMDPITHKHSQHLCVFEETCVQASLVAHSFSGTQSHRTEKMSSAQVLTLIKWWTFSEINWDEIVEQEMNRVSRCTQPTWTWLPTVVFIYMYNTWNIFCKATNFSFRINQRGDNRNHWNQI